FIPTHVGNTWGRATSSTRLPVHPHARGEHRHLAAHQQPMVGSSPRTWGTLQRREAQHTRVRFIPTHVGNTRAGCAGRLGDSVHPHARGEHGGASTELGSAAGS